MLLALTVVGRVALTPAEPLDARIAAAFNAHQRRGRPCSARTPSRPPSTAPRTARGLVRPSPWRLDAAHADLAAEWLDGWVAAACEQEPALAAEAARLPGPAPGAGGRRASSRVTVDHADLLVLP